MKKLLALLLAAALAFSLGSGMAWAADSDDIVGSYTLTDLNDGSGDDTGELLSMLTAFGMSATLTVEADGSGVMDFFGDSSSLTFDFQSGMVSAAGDAIPYYYENGVLTLPVDHDLILFFTKDGSVPTAAAAPVVDTQEELSFYGPYVMTAMDLEGEADQSEILQMLSSMGLAPTLTIEDDGSAQMLFFDESHSLNFNLNTGLVSLDGEIEIPFQWDGSSVSFSNNGTAVVFTRVQEDSAAPAANSLPAQHGRTELPADRGYVLGETVLVDNADCSFTLTGVREDDYQIIFTAHLENRTDKDLYFTWDFTTVNNYLVEPYWGATVSAGKKSNVSIYFDKEEDLEAYGLLPMDELAFNLVVRVDNDWTRDPLVDERFTVYPTGLDADSVVYPPRIAMENEQLIMDNRYATLSIYDAGPDDWYGYVLYVYFSNNSDRNMWIDMENVSINDYMIDPYWSASVPPHTAGYDRVTFYASDLEDNRIDEVEQVEFRIDLVDLDTWDTIFSDSYSYTP